MPNNDPLSAPWWNITQAVAWIYFKGYRPAVRSVPAGAFLELDILGLSAMNPVRRMTGQRLYQTIFETPTAAKEEFESAVADLRVRRRPYAGERPFVPRMSRTKPTKTPEGHDDFGYRAEQVPPDALHAFGYSSEDIQAIWPAERYPARLSDRLVAEWYKKRMSGRTEAPPFQDTLAAAQEHFGSGCSRNSVQRAQTEYWKGGIKRGPKKRR